MLASKSERCPCCCCLPQPQNIRIKGVCHHVGLDFAFLTEALSWKLGPGFPYPCQVDKEEGLGCFLENYPLTFPLLTALFYLAIWIYFYPDLVFVTVVVAVCVLGTETKASCFLCVSDSPATILDSFLIRMIFYAFTDTALLCFVGL